MNVLGVLILNGACLIVTGCLAFQWWDAEKRADRWERERDELWDRLFLDESR